MKTNRYLKRPDLLMEVRDCIANNPQRFTYGHWFKSKDGIGPTYTASGKQMQCNDNWCGTMACVAGHAIALSCPSHITIRQFMTNVMEDNHCSETQVANSLFEVNWEYYWHINKFLYSPWYWADKNGVRVTQDIDQFPELAVQEAIARINWILDDKDLEQYEITNKELIDQEAIES